MSMEEKPYKYAYPRPSLTVDAMVFNYHSGKFELLLIKRKDDPYKDCWAFPGGFIDEGESAENAVVRELREETGLQVSKLQQLITASKPGRDPRGWTVSVVFIGFMSEERVILSAGDDAALADWHRIDRLPELAFDHGEIFSEGIKSIRKGLFTDHILQHCLPGPCSKSEIATLLKLIYGSDSESEKLIQLLLLNGQVEKLGQDDMYRII